MKKLFLVLAVLLQAAVAHAQLEVEAPEVVSLDEQFNVSFIYKGESNPSDFSWDPGSDFQLVWGPQQGRSTSIRSVNGKTTKTTQISYTYVLKPLRTGSFTLPSATITVKGANHSSKPVNINVVSGGAQARPQQGQQGGSPASSTDISGDDLFLRMTFDKTNVVVGEPVVATLKLYQRVNLAGFEDARFPSFNGFWNQEVEAPTNIEFKRESYNDKIYNVALLRKYVLIPQRAGTLTVDAAELVCLVNVKVVSSGSQSIFDDFFNDYRTIRKRISTPSYNIRVSALPAGAPASFKGGVGKLAITAELSRDSLVTHEAASLIVTVSGQGNISLLEAPDVVFPPDFEVYDTKVTEKTDKSTGGTRGSKTYEFPFIPRSHGDFAIAPVKYSYYDISQGRYVTLETRVIPFTVLKGEETESVSTGAALPSVNRQGVKNLNEDIRFINVKSPSLSAKGYFFVGSPLFWGLAAGIVLLALVIWFILTGLAARRADVVGTKTRKAVKMAKRRLNKAAEYLKQNIYSAFYEELHRAILGYVSDKLNIAVADLSKDAIGEALSLRGVQQDLTDRLLGLIDACEFARYSPDSGHEAMAEHYQQAEDIISSIDSNMKNTKKNGAAAVAVALLAFLAPMNAQAADAYVDSLWNAGNDAYTQGYWSEAVSAYQAIESLGLESAPLYCNLGNSYFKSRDYTMAIVYYERALKLDPSYSDAKYNLSIASELIQDRIEPVPEFILKTWTRNLCYALDSNTWAVLALLFLAVTAAAVVLFFRSGSTAAMRAGFFSGIIFLLLTIFAAMFSFWQKGDYMRQNEAVILSPVISVKSSPSSETSTDLFILHEGTKVTIIDEVGTWSNIELADGRQGWVRGEELVVI